MTDTAYSETDSITSPVSVTYGDESSTVIVEITSGDCRVVISSITGTSEDITIVYTLEDDRSGTASVKPMYATSSSGAFAEMTESTDPTSEGRTGLTTSPTGEEHTFIWNTIPDIGAAYKSSVWIKIRAYDRDNFIGDTMESATQTHDVDNAPLTCTLSLPTTGYFTKETQLEIRGTITDTVAGYSDEHVKIQIATDANFETIEKTFESRIGGGQWDYYDGANWIEFPADGIPVSSTPALIGKSWRFIPDSEEELTTGTKYIRAFIGEKTA